MANIWKQNRDASQNVKRNNFDLSMQSHSTFKFGYLYPVFKRRVVPGDSFRIESAFDLKMMPVAFPIQSRIRAHMHFFYVRNKNLWKNWQDWLVGTKTQSDHPHPYIRVSDSNVQTGSIHDFLGQPTTFASDSKSVLNRTVVDRSLHSIGGSFVSPFIYNVLGISNRSLSITPSEELGSTSYPCFLFKLSSLFNGFFDFSSFGDVMPEYVRSLETDISVHVNRCTIACLTLPKDTVLPHGDVSSVSFQLSDVFTVYSTNSPTSSSSFSKVNYDLDPTLVSRAKSGLYDIYIYINFSLEGGVPSSYSSIPDTVFFDYSVTMPDVFAQWSDSGIPFYSDNVVPLSALPYRAYESIYRAYYASDVWQPLMIDGQKEYNKYVTNDDDGADYTDYHLFRRNYELDFLTSALPSPQDGPAPLVGIVDASNRIISIRDEDGETQVKIGVDTDGRITDADVVSDIASGKHAKFAASLASGREYVQGLGFTINDFRAGNAYQRFKEWTMRVGYRYQKFVKGHFDVEPEYKELDMPEFIGGYSRDVDISTVVSQADTLISSGDSVTGKELGEFTGLGRLVGGSNHSITHFCDDFGWIIGIMCITPTPAYSQLLPKENICPTSPLDYSFPEFNQLGYQPIPYKEVSPLQIAYNRAFGDTTLDYESTFGYQRPCYDLVGSVDEVHGEFRDSLHSMLINRIFSQPPELGSSFLEIDPSEVNDIFINQNPDDDVFIGHLAFKVTPKRPYPRVHIPSLGI